MLFDPRLKERVDELFDGEGAFKRLAENLDVIKRTVHKLDPEAEIFIFGSVAENRCNYSSDIDVLIITRIHPATAHFELWKAGVKDPFEVHVHPQEKLAFYEKRAILIKV
jgi:predicted nucleotidyltransferase